MFHTSNTFESTSARRIISDADRNIFPAVFPATLPRTDSERGTSVKPSGTLRGAQNSTLSMLASSLGMSGVGVYPGFEIADVQPAEPRNKILNPVPLHFTVEPLPPTRYGTWHYGARVVPILNKRISYRSKPIVYEIWRRWDDCLELQRAVEKEFDRICGMKRKLMASTSKHDLYHSQRAASFDSLPLGPDPVAIPPDVHALVPKLSKRVALFRASANIVEQRGEQFSAFLTALFGSNDPLLEETRDALHVREFFGWWKRDKDSLARRNASLAYSHEMARKGSDSTSSILDSTASTSSISNVSTPNLIPGPSSSTPALLSSSSRMASFPPRSDSFSSYQNESDPFHRAVSPPTPPPRSTRRPVPRAMNRSQDDILSRHPGPAPTTPLPAVPNHRSSSRLSTSSLTQAINTFPMPPTPSAFSASSPPPGGGPLTPVLASFPSLNGKGLPSAEPQHQFHQDYGSISPGVARRSISLEAIEAPQRVATEAAWRALARQSLHSSRPSSSNGTSRNFPLRRDEEADDKEGPTTIRATSAQYKTMVMLDVQSNDTTPSNTLRRHPRASGSLSNAANRNARMFIKSSNITDLVEARDVAQSRTSEEFMRELEIVSPVLGTTLSSVDVLRSVSRIGHRATSSLSSATTNSSNAHLSRRYVPSPTPLVSSSSSQRSASSAVLHRSTSLNSFRGPSEFANRLQRASSERRLVDTAVRGTSVSPYTARESPKTSSPSHVSDSEYSPPFRSSYVSSEKQVPLSRAQVRLSRSPSGAPIRRSFSLGSRRPTSFRSSSIGPVYDEPEEQNTDSDLELRRAMRSPLPDDLIDSYMYEDADGSSESPRTSLESADIPSLSRNPSTSSKHTHLNDPSRAIKSQDDTTAINSGPRRESIISQLISPTQFPRPFQNRPPGQFHLPWSNQSTPLSSPALFSSSQRLHKPSLSSLHSPHGNRPTSEMCTLKVLHAPSGNAVLLRIARTAPFDEVRAKITQKFKDLEDLTLEWGVSPSAAGAPNESSTSYFSTLALYCRVTLGNAPLPQSPARVNPGRSRSASVASSMNGYDASQFVLIQDEDEWARAKAAALAGTAEKISLRIVEGGEPAPSAV